MESQLRGEKQNQVSKGLPLPTKKKNTPMTITNLNIGGH